MRRPIRVKATIRPVSSGAVRVTTRVSSGNKTVVKSKTVRVR